MVIGQKILVVDIQAAEHVGQGDELQGHEGQFHELRADHALVHIVRQIRLDLGRRVGGASCGVLRIALRDATAPRRARGVELRHPQAVFAVALLVVGPKRRLERLAVRVAPRFRIGRKCLAEFQNPHLQGIERLRMLGVFGHEHELAGERVVRHAVLLRRQCSEDGVVRRRVPRAPPLADVIGDELAHRPVDETGNLNAVAERSTSCRVGKHPDIELWL